MTPYLFIGLVLLPVVLLFIQRGRDRKRGWRIYGIGRDEMKYEEYENGKWIGVVFYAEMEGWNGRRVWLPDKEKFENAIINWSSERKNMALNRIKEYSKSRKWSIVDEGSG